MPHKRKADQSVDAFSLPNDLLAKAKAKAIEMRMTKSGFYRYCLAKFLGYSEEDARGYAEHRAVLNSLEAAMVSRDKSNSKIAAKEAEFLGGQKVSYLKRPRRARKSAKPQAGVPTAPLKS